MESMILEMIFCLLNNKNGNLEDSFNIEGAELTCEEFLEMTKHNNRGIIILFSTFGYWRLVSLLCYLFENIKLWGR